MSYTHNHIKLILNFVRDIVGKKPMTVYEMAESLVVNPKTIRRYLEDLRECGVKIKTHNGPHGIQYHQITYKSIDNFFRGKS